MAQGQDIRIRRRIVIKGECARPVKQSPDQAVVEVTINGYEFRSEPMADYEAYKLLGLFSTVGYSDWVQS